MSSRADPLIEANSRNTGVSCCVDGDWLRKFSRHRHSPNLLVFAIALTASAGALAEEPRPEGMKGWWYYISLFASGYAGGPQEACRLSAANHFDVKLSSMKPSPLPKPIFHCFYKNPIGGRVSDYALTRLYCESGYTAKSPGVCVKKPEAPRPPSCKADEPGYGVSNPVAVASGAKVQSETDFPGAPNGTLRITRTYRTLRDGGAGQSAGQAWSFSFDRNFTLVFAVIARAGDPPESVTGAFGDGSSFEFNLRDSGVYVSKYDKRESLKSLNAAFDDWMLTTRDGSIERYKKVDGKFLLVSSHSKEGVGQFYTYGPDNKLATIVDASGRTLKVTWTGEAVASIVGPTGSIRYGYEMDKFDEEALFTGAERLATVEFYDEVDRLLSTKRYHYEDPYNRYLLTGITDENGARFATYAYNGSGQTVLSEHAGGAYRHTFAYPEEKKRIITDPL